MATIGGNIMQCTRCTYFRDVTAARNTVLGDEDFVFYGAPEHPDGTVRLTTDGPTEQAVTVGLERLPLEIHRVVIAAAIDGAATFSDVGAIEFTATFGLGAAPTARATLDAATTERTMILAELCRRGEGWRLRAVGQGYDHGLAGLARGYGVGVDHSPTPGHRARTAPHPWPAYRAISCARAARVLKRGTRVSGSP